MSMWAATTAETLGALGGFFLMLSAVVVAWVNGWFTRSDNSANRSATLLGQSWEEALEGQRAAFAARLALLAETVVELRAKVEEQAGKTAKLETENAVLKVHGLRFEPVPGAEPMSQFFLDRWNDLLAETAERIYGVRPVLHADNIDEATVTGYKLVPVEDLPPTKLLSDARLASSRRIQAAAAAQARQAADHPPHEDGTETGV